MYLHLLTTSLSSRREICISWKLTNIPVGRMRMGKRCWRIWTPFMLISKHSDCVRILWRPNVLSRRLFSRKYESLMAILYRTLHLKHFPDCMSAALFTPLNQKGSMHWLYARTDISAVDVIVRISNSAWALWPVWELFVWIMTYSDGENLYYRLAVRRIVAVRRILFRRWMVCWFLIICLLPGKILIPVVSERMVVPVVVHIQCY